NEKFPDYREDDSYGTSANQYLYAIWGTSFLRELQEDYITLPIADFDTKMRNFEFTLKTETATETHREYEKKPFYGGTLRYTIDFSGTEINKLTYRVISSPSFGAYTEYMKEWKREAYVLYPNSFDGKMTIDGKEHTYNLSEKGKYETDFKENISQNKVSEATVSIINGSFTVTSGLSYIRDVKDESFIEVIRNQ
ncbi:MAG: hypothetical protein ACRCZB_10640, partial [Bacteroidales bacterium]